MADLTRFSISKNGFIVKIADQGLVATVDGDGYEATTPYYRIIIHNEAEGIAFSQPEVGFTSQAVHDEEGFWHWSDVDKAAEEAVKALKKLDVINLIEYDTYTDFYIPPLAA
jgi:hypothetical protein